MAALFLAPLAIESVASAQPAKPEGETDVEESAEAWYDYYRQRATSDYQIAWSEDAKPLVLNRQPILNWTNPLEGGKINGSTFLWEDGGRPIVVGQFFSYLIGDEKRSYCHVFSTFSDRPLVARRGGTVFWQPTLDSETQWRTDTDLGPAAPTRAGRLIQMRRFARCISASTEEKTRGKRPLRFLPHPLYRYDEGTKGFDGGVFAYVVGNDPELLLLIECELTAKEPRWRYRFAQSTQSTTVATRNAMEVYRYAKSSTDAGSIRAYYHSKHGVETIPRDVATTAPSK